MNQLDWDCYTRTGEQPPTLLEKGKTKAEATFFQASQTSILDLDMIKPAAFFRIKPDK